MSMSGEPQRPGVDAQPRHRDDRWDAPDTAAVIGVGTMGQGITLALALQGLEVAVIDADRRRTAEARSALEARVRRYAAQGLVDEASASRAAAVSTAASPEEASEGADFIVEAVPEHPDTKREVLARCSEAAPPDAVIATNTSSLPIDALAGAVTHPERFLGVHWFNPPEWIPGVEIIAGKATLPHVIDSVRGFLRSIGKEPVCVGSAPGFVANRLQFALVREAILCWQDGVATPEEIDAVVKSTFSWRLPFFGPFAIADLAGLDVYEAILDTLTEGLGERFAAPEILRELVAEGRVGTKAGRGFFEYENGAIDALTTLRDHCLRSLSRVVTDNGKRIGASVVNSGATMRAELE